MPTDWRVFIHLSEIHFNKSSGGTYDLDKDLRNELTLDSQKVFRDLGGPDAILITGDISFSGAEKEYTIAKLWLDEYTEKLDRSLANVFCVPGNHDVDHSCKTLISPILEDKRKKLREIDIQNLELEFNQYLTDPLAQELIFQPIDEYNRFARAIKCNIKADKPIKPQIFELNDKSKLIIHGLNSIIISDYLDKEYKKIVLGRFQLPDRSPEVTNLIMCHHPPNWWRDRDLIENSFDVRSSIQLFGHKHSQSLEKINNSLRMTAGAVHPSRKDSNWKPRYNWFRVAVSGEHDLRKLVVEAYPRIWSEKKPIFIPDYNSCGGKEFIKYELKLEQWEFTEATQRAVDMEINKVDNYTANTYYDSDQFGNMDPSRILTYRFFDLPHVVRISIASELGLYLDEDEGLKDSDIFERIFDRACLGNVLDLLWDKVEESHGDHKYPKNPFKKSLTKMG